MLAQNGHQPTGATVNQARPGSSLKIEGRHVGARVDQRPSGYRFQVHAFGLPLTPQIRGKLNLDFDDGRKVFSKLDFQHAGGRNVLVTIGIATVFTAGSPAFTTR